MLDWVRQALSEEQQAPLIRSTKNAVILAAAGSGKTRTLVHLLAQDLADGIPPQGIVAFTFTEKAAEELLARVHAICRKNLPNVSLTGIYVGTIHSWCLRYLSEQSEFYNFTPIDELHTDALVSRLYDELGLEKAYGEPYPHGTNKFLADLEVFYNEHLELAQVPAHIRPSIAKFLDVLYRNRLMTFGGMIRHAVEHLQANGPVNGLKALYVDEYQDVNPAQVALIKAMLPDDGKVVVVGDDLQCIYQWRGSDVNRILHFSEEFEDASVHRLTTNYRARPAIVELANKVAENISVKDPLKVMRTGREDPGCPAVLWLSLESQQEQARAVVQIVKRFASHGVPWNRIAVLLRSVVGSGKPIVDALSAEGIPVNCPILSRGGDFIEEFLIPIFDWLRREQQEPKNEIEAAKLEEAADQLWHKAKKWVQVKEAEEQFWSALNEWMDAIEQQRNDAYDVRGHLYHFLDRCGIRVTPDDSSLMVGLGIASQIIRSVEEIHRRRLHGQPRRTPRGVMSEVYHALIRHHQTFGESVPIDTVMDGVVVTTVHQSKGLEWPVVIIPMLASRRFPVSSRGHGTSFPDSIAGRYGTSLEDERRLFYVAVTRAKERLFLLDPASGQSSRRNGGRSIFLTELEKCASIRPTTLSQIPADVWKISEKDLEHPDPPPVRVGLSDILLHVECPYQFGLRRIAGVQPAVGDELGFGEGLHELIQRRLESDSPWTSDDRRRHVEKYVNLPYMSENGEAAARSAIEDRLEVLERLGVFDLAVESEVDVEVVLDSGIVHGVVDGIQREDDETVLVRDWKSNIHDELVPRYERQLQFYVYALRKQGKRVRKADIVDVGASVRNHKLVVRDIDISDRNINRLVTTVERSLRNIGEGKFHPNPGPATCAACDMYRLCGKRWKQ